MNKSSVDPACTGQFSPLFMDYIRQEPSLRPFYNQFPQIQHFKKLIDDKNFDTQKRIILSTALRNQYAGVASSKKTDEQISLLEQDNTFTVTTGHQLNLFTGPLYFIYKIVSTINLAKRLGEAYPGYNFVPVYWMATEDHDFEEVNYFKLEGKKYQWLTDQKGPVGKFEIEDSFRAFWKEVSFVPGFFKAAYLESATLAEAVRKYVHYLFGDKGLLIMDGDDASLKRLFIPVIKEDLLHGTPHKSVARQTDRLEKLGYGSQIFPREINLFYMDKGIRERIEKKGDQYHVLNTGMVYGENELMDLVMQSPEKFSPNVVLRPLYQEQILPNLAYLGGPAEVVYWLQLKSLFDHFDTAFPAVMPRNFAVVLDGPTERKIKKLNLSDQDLFMDFEEWKKGFVAKNSTLDIFLKSEHEKLTKLFEESGQTAGKVDRTLEPAFEAAKVRVAKILTHLSGKVRKAEERKQTDAINQMQAIKNYLYPGGSPQERVENFMKFYLEDRRFVEQLLELFDPFDFNFMVLSSQHEQSKNKISA